MKRHIALSLVLFITLGQVKSQTAELPLHRKQLSVDFGSHDGKKLTEQMTEYSQFFYYNPTPAHTAPFPQKDYIVIKKSVSAGESAPWIRLRFDGINLKRNSYIKITSQQDGDSQYFNSSSISEWKGQTAFFTGGDVDVYLYVAPGDTSVTLKITEMVIGEFYGDQPPVDLCGADNRVSSSYPYVDGRILPIGCTGYITAAGFYLTAGHCVNVSSYDLQVIQFNVPPSLCDGTLVPSAIEDQYPIIYSSRVWEESDAGDDWGIFNCGTNSNTNLTPAEAQRAYYHLSKNLNPANIQIRGFGTDHTPSGCTGYYNSDSQTLQYDVGDNLGEYFNGSNDVYWEYLVDTEGGNSGSAIMSSGVSGVYSTAIGIHTHGGCNPPNQGNKGTSFEADDTEAAMNHYWQTQSVYVDEGHHLNSTVGTSVKPCVSLQTGLNKANAGHGPGLELILVAGSNHNSGGIYNESISYSGAVNGVKIRRTVGAVKIGPGASDNTPAPGGNPKKDDISYDINSFPDGLLPGQTKKSLIDENDKTTGNE
jgi:V8-like Glu-specific endopeptidase